MHLIGPWYRNSFERSEQAIHALIDGLAQAMQGLYRMAHPALYLLAVVVLALGYAMGWGVAP
jgi:NADH-quinone oxidoreductase subunit M